MCALGENAPAGCSKWPSSKAAASEDPEAYPLGYVEDLNDARTQLATFFSILFLHEQQACLANLLPGGRTQKDFKLFDGPWKSRFRFPEERVKTRWAVLSCGVLNQIVKPLRLRVCEGDGLIEAVPWKNESCFFSSLLTNRLPTEPDESPLCLRVISADSFLEEIPYPCGGDAWLRHGMVEPLPDVEREAASFQIIQQRPSQPFAEPLGRFTLSVLVQQVILRKAMKLGSENAQSMANRVEPDWTMCSDGEPVPEGRLNQVCCE
jgi:hypothetical protein